MGTGRRHKRRSAGRVEAGGATAGQAAPGTPAPRRRLPGWAIAAALFAGTFLLYTPSLSNDFVEFDDHVYVTKNATVQRGLTLDNVRWAFTTTEFANWLPVTWLSHMLDVELFGLNPAGHHATSAGLHALNAALTFMVLRSLTGSVTRSAAAAALFAVHPFRVESATWIAERKDVLAATFFFLALLAYARYARRPGVWRYVAVAVLLGLGLMSKTMLVTFPCVLLLLDYWPLRRFTVDPATDGMSSTPRLRWRRALRLVLEKVPLLAMAAVSSAWTVALQRSGGALWGGRDLTLGQRLANAVVSVPRYLWQTVRPVDLSAFYPHPGSWPYWQVAGAALLVLALSAAAAWQVRRRPYLFVGWFWFLGMLVPVSGIAAQAGLQSIADRYTYLPSVGLMLAFVWGVSELAAAFPAIRRALVPAFAAAVAALGVATWVQQRYWASTFDLFGHAMLVDPDNWLAHDMVALVYSAQGDDTRAAEHLARSVELEPNHHEPRHNFGWSLQRLGRHEEAVEQFRQALRIQPDYGVSYFGLGYALASLGRYDEAYAAFAEAERLVPVYPDLQAGWGGVLLEQGRRDEAAARFAKALQMDPNHEGARRGLAEARAPRTAPAVGPAT